MRITLRSLLTVIALAVVGASAALADDGLTYPALLQRLKAGDRTIDFTALRKGYAASPDYRPYETNYRLREQLDAAVKAQRYLEALGLADRLLETKFLDLQAHLLCMSIARRTQDEGRFAFHRFVLRGVIDSVRQTGDGLSFQTAYAVTTMDEEYAVLQFLGVEVENTAVVAQGGHEYDRVDGTNMKTGSPVALYFQVDQPLAWMKRQMQAPAR
jgi:hypothetical protein